MTRNFYQWLRFNTTHEIKNKHSEIYRHYRKEQKKQWFNTFINRKDWWLIPLYTVLLMVIMAAIYPSSVKEAATMINQRISNLATVTSLSLAVIGFLMSNIATKEPYAYQVVFDTSKMHVIIFFILSFLGCSVLAATIVEPLSPCFWFPRFTVAIGFIFIPVIALIGYMFNQVIRYTDQAKIDRFMHDELERNISVLIYETLINKISLQIYQRIAKKYGAQPYDGSSVENWDHLNTEMRYMEHVPGHADDSLYLKDIDLYKLAHCIKWEKGAKVYFKDLQLDMPISPDAHFLRLELENNTEDFNRAMRKSLHFGKRPAAKKSMLAHREHFDEKLVSYAADGKNKELSRILESLSMLYWLKVKYRLEGDNDPTENLKGILYRGLYKAFAKKHTDCIGIFHDFFALNAKMAFDGEDTGVLTFMLDFFTSEYLLMSKKTEDQSFEEVIGKLQGIPTIYQVFNHLLVELQIKERNDLSTVNALGKAIYYAFSNLLHQMVRQGDFTTIKDALKKIEDRHGSLGDTNIKHDLEALSEKFTDAQTEEKRNLLLKAYQQSRMLENYRRQVFVSLRSWILHLFNQKKISAAAATKFLNENSIPGTEPEDTVYDVLFFRTGKIALGHMGWLSWHYEEKIEELFNPLEWLTRGFMIEQIMQNNLPLFASKLVVSESDNISILIENLNKIKDELIAGFDYWNQILKLKDDKELAHKAELVISFFGKLQAAAAQSELGQLATSTLDAQKVVLFNAVVEKTWKERANIYTLLSYHGKVNRQSSAQGLTFVGRRDGMADYKKLFLDHSSGDVTWLNDIGSQAGRNLDTKLFRQLKDSQPELYFEPDLISGMDKHLFEMREQGFKVNAIFIPTDLAGPGLAIWSHAKFVSIEKTGTGKLSPNHFGFYDKIPTFRFQPYQLDREVILLDLDLAVEMNYLSDNDKFEEVLEVDVHAIGEEEAEEILNKKFPGDSISKEEKEKQIQSIRSHIYLSVGAMVNYKIINRDAIRVIRIVNPL